MDVEDLKNVVISEKKQSNQFLKFTQNKDSKLLCFDKVSDDKKQISWKKLKKYHEKKFKNKELRQNSNGLEKRKSELDHQSSKWLKTNQIISEKLTSKRQHQTSILDYWNITAKMANNLSPSKLIINSNDELMSELKEFQSEASSTTELNLSSPYTSYKQMKIPEQVNKTKELVTTFLDKKLENVPIALLSKIKKRKYSLDNELGIKKIKAEILKKANLPFLNKLKNLNEKISQVYSDQLIKLNEKPNKFFKEKQQRKLRAQKLIESSPDISTISNENIQFVNDSNQNNMGLPEKYLDLCKIFRHFEQVLSVMYNRSETCKFSKLRQSVQRATKRDFNLSHFAQMLTIFPNAYKVSLDMTSSIEKYELVIRPNVVTTKMTYFTIMSRTNQFRDNIFLFAKRAHTDFLLTIEEPIIVNDTEVIRWHPNFMFPKIPESKLPQYPAIESPRNQNILINNYLPPNINKTKVENTAVQLISTANPSFKAELFTKINDEVAEDLSQDLAVKVQNKGEQVAILNANEENQAIELKKLYESVRMIQSYFVSETKKTIQVGKLIKKFSFELSISPNEGLNLIETINKYLPDWFLILNTTKEKFVKINPRTPIESLYVRLQRAIKPKN